MKLTKRALFVVLISLFLFSSDSGKFDDSLLAEGSGLSGSYFNLRAPQDGQDDASCIVTARSDDLLGKIEESDREFIRIETEDKIIYFHQRKISEVIVEKDFIVYLFFRDTRELIDKIVQWRSDLPDYVVPGISRETAELMAEGDSVHSNLYIISPKSDVFPIIPIPENPCWIVRSIADGNTILTVVDAMNGEILGYGIPPPENGFSLSGPHNQNPCSGSWDSWYLNARSWFNSMGYPTIFIRWPARNEIQNAVQDSQVMLFYELAHGDYYYFAGGCSNGDYEYTFATNIEDWISSYPKKKFVFIGSCGGMCSTGDDSLSYEFRKGSSVNTATVGYCGMAAEECENCWSNSVDWQSALFNYMSQGYTVKQAFDAAVTDYPMCYDCVRFAGDADLVLVSSVVTLTLAAGTGGTTIPAPGIYTYDLGTQVTITAIPDTYYGFKGWSGAVSGKANPLTATMTSDKSITATFIKINPPSNFTGQRMHNYSFTQDEYINNLTWEAHPGNENIAKYKLYLVEGEGRSLLSEFNADVYKYWHRGVEKDKQYTYILVAVNDRNREGEPAYVTIR